MKFESLENLYFIIAVFVPGFIYEAVLSKFIPRHLSTMRELVLLRLFSATALNYGVWSPLIYLLVTNSLFANSPSRQAITWLVIIFISPIALALVTAKLSQENILSRCMGWLPRLMRLRPISPIPTGWDWIFGRTDPCFVIVTLTDGNLIAGYFGLQSLASSDPARRDIYLERQYVIPNEGEWEEVPDARGIYIEGSHIAFIEFRG